jgi:methylenetetrahydrofolate reductase (NADPH)
MRLRDIYAQPGLKLSIEFFPPKTADGVKKLMEEAEVLSALRPNYCSVTYGATGSTRDTTVEMVERIHLERGLDVMCHLTVVGQSRDDVRTVLADLKRRGIENIIALRGDPPRGEVEWQPHPDGFLYSVDLVREARKLDWFSIAVAGFPETHPQAESPEADLRFLKEKVDAGADVVITQLFFENEDYRRFVERCREMGLTVPIVPGIMPILSSSQITRITNLCGAKIPPRLQALLDKVAGDDEAAVRLGIDFATEQVAGLIEFGVPGIHFYALNRSRSTTAVLENLGLTRADRRAAL